jgi:hypothetical protein
MSFTELTPSQTELSIGQHSTFARIAQAIPETLEVQQPIERLLASKD